MTNINRASTKNKTLKTNFTKHVKALCFRLRYKFLETLFCLGLRDDILRYQLDFIKTSEGLPDTFSKYLQSACFRAYVREVNLEIPKIRHQEFLTIIKNDDYVHLLNYRYIGKLLDINTGEYLGEVSFDKYGHGKIYRIDKHIRDRYQFNDDTLFHIDTVNGLVEFVPYHAFSTELLRTDPEIVRRLIKYGKCKTYLID